ncbi:hypothetical protein [Cedecea sp. NFIX57]|uniref:hypothetical protein n=1 Tax=Cedecea sp. NFIX57 TaxID=1566286 RepID=UPI0015931FE2|nr:hypothetical protein [Cedecea sp. NFIX57]
MAQVIEPTNDAGYMVANRIESGLAAPGASIYGLLENSLATTDGATRNGMLTAKIEGTGSGNYELTNDAEYFPAGTYKSSSSHVFKMTNGGVNSYSLTATSANDVPASELVSGLYAYHFVANSYTE